MLFLRPFLTGLLAVLLAGCASVPPNAIPPRPARDAIETFEVEARLSVRNEQQIHVARVTWRHRAGTDEILVTDPLGQGVAELWRAAAGARLRTADRREATAPDWNALGEKVFGIRLPLDELPHWMTGAVPGAELDASSRPLRAEVQGWHIEFAEYESARPDALPTLIRIERGDIAIKVKVDQWQLP